MSRIATPYCSNELVEGSHEVAHVAGALLVRGHELRQRVKDDEVGRTRSVRCSPSDSCTYDLTIRELGYRVDLSMETSV